jgi:hypothetical protein
MIPEHYSRDIVQRCGRLIDTLLPVVKGGSANDFGGPLSTTLLLALGTPMIVLPCERILQTNRVGNDRHVDPDFADGIHAVLGNGTTFADAPFGGGERWSYVSDWPRFNIAQSWPHDLLHSLAEPQAVASANSTPARQVITDLRNALAHGGVIYLDVKGQQSGDEAAMLAFVGTVHNGPSSPFNILRISEEGFQSFLQSWANWLVKCGVQSILNNADPLAE